MRVLRILSLFALVALGALIGFGYGRWYGPRAHPGATHQTGNRGYHCPMHPGFRSDKPGVCGICGMKLVPDDDPAHPSHATAESPATRPPGAIHISPEKQQLIGVEFAPAEMSAGVQTLRAVGAVAMDETRLARVQARVDGWIEKVLVDFTGKLVEKGQPLLTLYSPEMLASQQEYLLAARGRELMRASPLAAARDQSESLLAASRRRLELWGLSGGQIDEIRRTGEPLQYITLFSPVRGYVMKRNAFPGQRITAETELYTLADLDRVWIMAAVFESDARKVRIGTPVWIKLAHAGGRTFMGRVDYIQPELDTATRTLKVRIEAGNPDLVLKPEMFVDVEFRIPLPLRVTVPSEAVLDSGLRQTVFVDSGGGYLEPRQVETGERSGGRIEITRGLRPGERVAVSGNFLIDSESRLKSAAGGAHAHD